MSLSPIALALALLAPATALAARAKAELKDAQGQTVGTATLREVKGGVEIAVHATGLAPGKHGFHLHAVGKCEGPDFKSAGPHFNPHAKKHGAQNPEGAHAGDLPNLDVGPDGKGEAKVVAAGTTLRKSRPGSLFGKDGTSLVIHADPDDEKTDPAGNSGARIACGGVARAR